MPNITRSFIHHVLALAIMSVYGSQVCPYLESLTTLQLVLPIVFGLIIQFPLLLLLVSRFALKGPDDKRVRRVFSLCLGLFMLTASTVMVYNLVVHGFPLGSGAKIVLGLGGIGFFAALDMALDAELALARKLHRNGQSLALGDRRFPLANKLILFTTVTVLVTIGILALVVFKDLDWMVHVGNEVSAERAMWIIIGELTFIGVILMTYVFNAITTFTRNLKYFFNAQTHTMEATTRGELNGFVPVTTQDELGQIADYTNQMVRSLKERDQVIRVTQDATILSLACLAETRDNETGNHIRRTQNYIRALADKLKRHPRFRSELGQDGYIDLLYKSAPLHDIGKVGIPDAILHKPARLDEDEFAIMKTHAALGAQAMEQTEAELGSNSFLRIGRQIALSHHEKWDGSGYPQGLKGDEIPLSARLMAVADVYDALISKRVYKPAFSHDKAIEIIQDGRGTHFDPDIIEAFLAIQDRFKDIAARFSDDPEKAPHNSGGDGPSPLDPAVAL